MAENVDGLSIAEILQKKGFTVKAKTKTSITLMVAGSRTDKMIEVSKLLSNLGAKIDSNMKGSSIGGIAVGNVKILIKSEGRTGGLDVEAKAISDLSDALLKAIAIAGGPITIKTKNGKISGVCQVIKTAGTPKSDFHLADKNGKPLIHISHKKGSTPRDFQQWGGITEERILNHNEVQEFAVKCRMLYGEKIPSGESVFVEIKDKNLKMMSVFGVDFDKSGIHTNKVDVLLQGDPGLKKISKTEFELTATGHVHYHGDIPDGSFEPVLAMIYKGDRDQLGIKGARASIYPKGGRSFKGELNQKLKNLK
jgi:hypothetical protein